MKKPAFTVLCSLTIAAMVSLPLKASAQDLGTCFIDSLTGKERKELVKWMYFSMSAHPELEPHANISLDDLQGSHQTIAKLITRLFPNEARAARKADPQALKKALKLVGKVAMQDILTDKAVRAAVNDYTRFVDQEKIKDVFLE
ncbi:hypothetical protein Q4508_19855 [Amphritea sp. 2_MG-2023]|uniref:hypothetical protein n=1 Tax=Amphritea TaxID=515417 RepID=UPI001C07E61D|nr:MULTISPECIES: hypothetical protein [Amphritea]MBU2966177.1 hypothetical protein [Amphritea atlantica]MDO6420812.1 hypothetical protein [Amphritea sp. 2_MG-2023]